jgi:hypothetical protein
MNPPVLLTRWDALAMLVTASGALLDIVEVARSNMVVAVHMCDALDVPTRSAHKYGGAS